MEEADLSLRNFVSLLRRQLKLIVVVVLGLTALASVVLFSLTPLYTASALLLVDTSPRNLLDPGFETTRAQVDDARVTSEVEIVQSAPVLLEVISKAALIGDQEFGVRLGLRDRVLSYLQIAEPKLPTGEAALQRVLDSVRKAVSAERRPRTNLLTLSVKSTDPTKAARLANFWAHSYIESQVTSKINGALLSRDALHARLEASRQNVVGLEGELDAFLDENIARLGDQSGRTDISDLRVRLASLDAERTSTSNLASAVERNLTTKNWSVLASSLQNQALAELDRQRQQLIDQASQSAGTNASDIRAELARIEQRLLNTAQGELGNLRSTIASYSGEVEDLRQQLRSVVLSSPLDPDTLARVYELQQTSSLARSQYQTLLARIQDLDIQANLQLADSRIIAEAMTPQNASFPNVPVLLAMSLAGSMLLAFVLAFLRENLVGGLLTAEQTSAVLRVPVAATLPRLGRDAVAGPADMVIDAMLSPYAENVRRIRAALEQRRPPPHPESGPGPGATVIMTTSAAPREGKSTVALALARSMAVARRKVLLIDCDLRRPSLNVNVGLPPDDRLRQVLAGERDFTELAKLVTYDRRSDVAVIVASASRETPTDQLVGGPIFGQLLDWAREHFDMVILDTPPIGSVVDGLYIAPLADGILYIVRSGATRQSEAKAGLQAIAGVKRDDCMLFAVLNQQYRGDATYGKQYAAYGY